MWCQQHDQPYHMQNCQHSVYAADTQQRSCLEIHTSLQQNTCTRILCTPNFLVSANWRSLIYTIISSTNKLNNTNKKMWIGLLVLDLEQHFISVFSSYRRSGKLQSRWKSSTASKVAGKIRVLIAESRMVRVGIRVDCPMSRWNIDVVSRSGTSIGIIPPYSNHDNILVPLL